MATSGDYATRFDDEYRRHHIFNPATGGSPTELASATIVAPSGLDADGLATAVMVLGQERGLKLWDGKVEWAMVDGGVCLVDSIGPDELRVGQDGAVMSKQFLRDFYLGTPWEQALVKGKDLAKARATSRRMLTASAIGMAPEVRSRSRRLSPST